MCYDKIVNVKLDYPKFYCIYTSRRDQNKYKYSSSEIFDKYNNYICMSGRMSEALSSAMGNEYFIAKFDDFDEMIKFREIVEEKE